MTLAYSYVYINFIQQSPVKSWIVSKTLSNSLCVCVICRRRGKGVPTWYLCSAYPSLQGRCSVLACWTLCFTRYLEQNSSIRLVSLKWASVDTAQFNQNTFTCLFMPVFCQRLHDLHYQTAAGFRLHAWLRFSLCCEWIRLNYLHFLTASASSD